MTEPQVPELGISRVELAPESFKTYRLEHGNESDEFPVVVWFTRQLDVYERAELANHGLDIEFEFENDTMRAVLMTTTTNFSQAVRTMHDDLPAVVADAKRTRAKAVAEDEHIGALVQQINLTINPQ